MGESKRFDPLGWLFSLGVAVLFAASSAYVAVCLIRSIWPWLVVGLGSLLTLVLLVRLFIWWHRGRSW